MSQSFATRLKQRREQLNMTQTELANAADTTPAAISQFESEKRNPSFKTVSKLSKALQVTTGYLMGERELGYADVLANPMLREMFTGILDFSEKDKQSLCDYYAFLKARAESFRSSSGEGSDKYQSFK